MGYSTVCYRTQVRYRYGTVRCDTVYETVRTVDTVYVERYGQDAAAAARPDAAEHMVTDAVESDESDGDEERSERYSEWDAEYQEKYWERADVEIHLELEMIRGGCYGSGALAIAWLAPSRFCGMRMPSMKVLGVMRSTLRILTRPDIWMRGNPRGFGSCGS